MPRMSDSHDAFCDKFVLEADGVGQLSRAHFATSATTNPRFKRPCADKTLLTIIKTINRTPIIFLYSINLANYRSAEVATKRRNPG